MKFNLFITILLFATMVSYGQSIDGALEKYNTNSVDYITVVQLKTDYTNYVILDTRARKEYEVSHLPGAIFIGDKEDFHNYLATKPDRSKPVVVYCSIGVRSEDAGETINKLGFTNVKNLYGGIFMWKDAGYKVVDTNNRPTEKVHVYSKEWGKYLKTGEKVY